MNRLWVRFALVISGILVLAMIMPFIAATQFEMSPELISGLESLLRALPVEQRAELRAQVELAIRLFFSRSLIVAAVAGTVAGVLLSWTLLSPLQELTRGAAAIAARDLAHRVRVRGSRELRDVAESFNHMAGRLEQAETLRRQLLADVAHELRNPLHVLRGNLQAMIDGVYPLDQAEVSRLLDQTDHLTRLVNDLHELALAEARQLPLDRRPADLGALVKESAAAFAPLAAADGIALRVELLGAPPLVDVDADRIRQTVQNLLANALRHTPPGGNVLVTVGRRDGAAEIVVRDSGEGIAPEHLPQVFECFFRGDDARDREHGGAGLGLAIVKAIVENHGGTVGVSSGGRGRGSTFTITLPAL